LHQAVILGVGDLRLVEDVIEVLMAPESLAERLDFALRAGAGKDLSVVSHALSTIMNTFKGSRHNHLPEG
jgi:hypothetical protein